VRRTAAPAYDSGPAIAFALHWAPWALPATGVSGCLGELNVAIHFVSWRGQPPVESLPTSAAQHLLRCLPSALQSSLTCQTGRHK
ncbi:unnamed protein product, partial [Effrenium voratum]